MIQDPLNVANQLNDKDGSSESKTGPISIIVKIVFTFISLCLAAAALFFQSWGFGTPSSHFYVGAFLIYAGMTAIWLYSKTKLINFFGYCFVVIGIYLTFVM